MPIDITITDVGNLSEAERLMLAGFLMQGVKDSATSVAENDTESAFGPADEGVPPSVDKDGLPWDERIHSSSRGMSQSGNWRKRKGVSDATVTEVEAELRKLRNVSGSNVLTMPDAPTPVVAASLPPPPPPPAEVSAAIPAPPVPAENTGRQEYVNLIDSLSTAIQAGKMTQPEVVALLKVHDVENLPDLQALGKEKIVLVARALAGALLLK